MHFSIQWLLHYRTIDGGIRRYKTNSGLSVGHEYFVRKALGTTMVRFRRRTQRPWYIFQI